MPAGSPRCGCVITSYSIHYTKLYDWATDFRGAEVSVEEEFGRELGLKLGDRVSFDIAGEVVSATVTSFRTVEWDSFSPNFFMVFSPGLLEDYPATSYNFV